uniref:Ninjurin-2 n=1 Tax=Culex pipiens TaxID=7175 RepID=A0A8D8JRA7_CULPI
MTRLDINNYATRKSFVQGMLDLALLTANAAQLKYLLSVGEAHPFYTILFSLIITSIALQVVQAIIIIILVLVLNINKTEEQNKSNIVNNVLMCISIVSVVINIIINAFDMRNEVLRK